MNAIRHSLPHVTSQIRTLITLPFFSRTNSKGFLTIVNKALLGQALGCSMTYHSSSCFLGFSHISLFLNPLCHAPISGPLHVLSFFFFPIWNPLLPSSWLAPILFYSNVTTLTALFKEYSSLITSSLLYQTYHELIVFSY